MNQDALLGIIQRAQTVGFKPSGWSRGSQQDKIESHIFDFCLKLLRKQLREKLFFIVREYFFIITTFDNRRGVSVDTNDSDTILLRFFD